MGFADDVRRSFEQLRDDARRAASEAYRTAGGKSAHQAVQLLRPKIADRPALRWLEPFVALGAAGGLAACALVGGAAMIAFVIAMLGVWAILRFVFGIDLALDPSAVR